MAEGKHVGVIVWPTHIEYEGVNAVLDRLVEAGVTAVATAAQVVEPSEDSSMGRREPPDDGGKGLVREVDRPIWGKKSLLLRASPSYDFNPELYKGLKYRPREADDLTQKYGHLIAQFLEEAGKRGLKRYLQVQVCHLPDTHHENSNIPKATEDLPRLPNGELPGNRMTHFAAIASDDVRAYFGATLRDLASVYEGIDGFILDRAEQSFYTLDEAFLDFGPRAKEKALQLGFDFEPMRAAAERLYGGLKSLSPGLFSGLVTPADLPYAVTRMLRTEPLIAEALKFRAAIASTYMSELRGALSTVKSDIEMIPIAFPPPLSLLTGIDFGEYAKVSDAIMIKFFTMHWPLIVTYWAEQLLQLNPELDESSVVRAVSMAFDFEDGDYGNSIADYAYPSPDQAHRAGSEACIRKIRQASTDTGGDVPILPSVHGYGPLEDVARRFKIGWNEGSSGMWINRYGYLSDEKLKMLKRLVESGG